jgi:Smg protein
LPFSHRIYAEEEYDTLGNEAIRFLHMVEAAGIIDPVLREIVIERALAADESPLSIEKLRLIVLVILWSQGEDPDTAMLNPAFSDESDRKEHLLH